MTEATATVENNIARTAARRVWRFLSSVRLALVLILILANLTLIGTLLIQVPPDTAADPSAYSWWLENVVRPKLGAWTTPLDFLGLFDVFHSFWFLGTGALLVTNIIVCTLNRWKQIRSAVFPERVRFGDQFYEGGTNRAAFTTNGASVATASEAVKGVLQGRGYRFRIQNSPEATYVAADKNRFFRLGTFVSHLSIVLFIVAFMLGSFLGFRNRDFMVPEGSTRDVGFGTGLSLRLDSFVDEYWPEGPPKDYRSEVVIYENGSEVKRGVIRVNHPMNYKGIRIYQSFFGPAAVMEVRDASGQTVYQDGVALGWVTGEKPFQRATGILKLPEAGLTAYVLAPSGGFDPLIKPGQMYIDLYRDSDSVRVNRSVLDPGVPVKMEGLEFTFLRERQFSGFQVSRDPGNMLVWISSGLFVLGLAMVFYFPHRQVWARIHTDQGGASKVSLRTTSTRSFGVVSEFESLTDALKRHLSSKTLNMAREAEEKQDG